MNRLRAEERGSTMHTANATKDEELYQIGAELVFGTESIGQVLDVGRDPISERVWRLITTYGPHARRVGVPVEWVVRRTPTRVTLAVGAHALDDLPDQPERWGLTSVTNGKK
jgi:hypothetical protein